MNSIEEVHALQIAKALGDPTRFLIYRQILEAGEMRCGDIALDVTVQAPTISHHLKILSDASLVASRRMGKGVYYRVVPRTLRNYLTYLRDLERRNRELRRMHD